MIAIGGADHAEINRVRRDHLRSDGELLAHSDGRQELARLGRGHELHVEGRVLENDGLGDPKEYLPSEERSGRGNAIRETGP